MEKYIKMKKDLTIYLDTRSNKDYDEFTFQKGLIYKSNGYSLFTPMDLDGNSIEIQLTKQEYKKYTE